MWIQNPNLSSWKLKCCSKDWRLQTLRVCLTFCGKKWLFYLFLEMLPTECHYLSIESLALHQKPEASSLTQPTFSAEGLCASRDLHQIDACISPLLVIGWYEFQRSDVPVTMHSMCLLKDVRRYLECALRKLIKFKNSKRAFFTQFATKTNYSEKRHIKFTSFKWPASSPVNLPEILCNR